MGGAVVMAGGGSGLPSSVVPVDDFSDFTPSSTQPLSEYTLVPVRTTPSRGDLVAPQPVLPLPPGWMSLDGQGRAVMDWTRRMPDPPKPPPPPVREVGPLEAAKRGVLSGAGTGMLPLVAASESMSPPTPRTPLQNFRREHGLPGGGLPTLTELAMDNVRQGELKPGEHYSGPLAEGIQAVTHVAGEAPFVAAESAGGPLLRGAAGAYSGYAIRKDQLKRAGLSDEQAERPAEIAGGLSGLFHAVPLGLPGSLATRVGTGAAAMGVLGPASRWVENRALPEGRPDLRQPVEDLHGAAYDLVSGGLFNGALGRRGSVLYQGRGLEEPDPWRPPPGQTHDQAADRAPPSEGRGLLGETEEDVSEDRSKSDQPGKPPLRPAAYSVAYEIKLDPSDFGKRRSVHNRLANTAMAEELRKNQDLVDVMKGEIPDLDDWATKAASPKTPAEWTWEHASTSTAFGQSGVMRLVPRLQHTPGSRWWRVFHPDKGASGGYAEWAVPNGAPRPKRKE